MSIDHQKTEFSLPCSNIEEFRSFAKTTGPDIHERTILPYPHEEVRFIRESFWCGQESVNIQAVVGTKHPDYSHLTWGKLLEKGKRMALNIPLAISNPGYYAGTEKKEPTMYFIQLDNQLYIGGDGNHRTCIAKFLLNAREATHIHGVTLHGYTTDQVLKNGMRIIEEEINTSGIPYMQAKEHSPAISRTDGPNYFRDTHDPFIQVTNYFTHEKINLRTADDIHKFLEALKHQHWAKRIFMRGNRYMGFFKQKKL